MSTTEIDDSSSNKSPPVSPKPLPHQPPSKPTSSRTRRTRQRNLADPAKVITPASAVVAANTAPSTSTLVTRVPQAAAPIPPPYPGPTFHVMNGAYPLSGPPYQQPHPAYPSAPSPVHGPTAPVPGMHPPVPQPVPAPPQYPYPMHPSYPPAYNPYPQYQQMMMYAQPQPPQPQPQPQPPRQPAPATPTTATAPTASPTSPESPSQQTIGAGVEQPPPSTGKRKRKSQDQGSGATASNAAAAASTSTATTGATSEGDARVITPAQVVAARQANNTSVLVDIKKRTKTQRACDSCRSRKIRCDILTDMEPPTCQHCRQYGFECTFFLPITETRFKKKKLEEEAANKDGADKLGTRKSAVSPHADSKGEPRVSVFGPTSTTHLLHSQATISSRVYENYDLRYHHTWEVSQNGDGVIKVQNPLGEEQQLSPPKLTDLRLERDVIEKLVNAYFAHVAPILPVVTQAEFIANPSPPPILLYSMCLVAAARRDVPQTVFDSIRYAVNGIVKAEDVLSTASIVNVQSLLILCMMGDCHSQYVPSALSALWIRLGNAIRMAQDLGLHRAESVKQNIELRRRLWGACLISDRWTSVTFGHPYMIDVQDCDARLPSSGDPNDRYMDELVRLSVILGRVQKTIYSPSGLTFATDDMLVTLLEDLEGWKHNLPEDLQFKDAQSNRSAGILHLLYSCVTMIFWRVFMRISYTVPGHLTFSLNVEKWSGLVKLTGEAIDWLDAHEDLYDVWQLVAYAVTSCALVQYHTWVRRQDVTAIAKLRTLRDCVRRWEASICVDHMSARRKTAEIISLLYEATQGPPAPLETPALNPTGGVQGKQLVGTLAYKERPSRPGGGVFVAHGEAKNDYKDLPEGVMVNSSSEDESEDDGGEREGKKVKRRKRKEKDEGSGSGSGGRSEGSSTASTPAAPGSMVNITPLGGGDGYTMNVNPAMNDGMGSVTAAPVGIPSSGGSDSGMLEGIPGGMFDWGQWDTFFSRFNVPVAGLVAGGGSGSPSQQQRQQRDSGPS